jgi:hypothetical protein
LTGLFNITFVGEVVKYSAAKNTISVTPLETKRKKAEAKAGNSTLGASEDVGYSFHDEMIRGGWAGRDRYHVIERRKVNATFLAGIVGGRDHYGYLGADGTVTLKGILDK